MANIQVFEYQNSKVRTVDMDGEAWFVVLASAICQKKACTTSGLKSWLRCALPQARKSRSSSQIRLVSAGDGIS